jgi:hypothetical protein
MSHALPEGWNAATRILVCDARDLAVLEELGARGLENVLVLTAPERLEALRSQAGPRARKIHAWTEADRERGRAHRHSADVLWLDGDSAGVLWSRSSLRAARQIVVRRSDGRARLALVARRALGLAAGRGSFDWAGASWSRFEIPGERKVRARRYLSPEIGLADFFAELERRRVRYLVLRWWETLPETAQGDVDLLVHDEDAAAFLEALGPNVGTIPLDIYASHGALGLGYRGATYYPAGLALSMLERSVLTERGVRRPAPRDALFSLAFHALYHKGPASGLPTALAGVEPSSAPKHDFAGILAALGREVGLQVPTSMEDLDQFLEQHGWRPPRDMLRKWANRNPWIRARHFSGSPRKEKPGWCVFVVRKGALEAGLADAIEHEITQRGFRVLAREELDPAAAGRFAEHARGGNWGQGEFAAHGGAPALFLIAFDPNPLPTRRRFARRYPDMDNGRIVEKRAIRDAVNARLPAERRANFLHTSDNSDEAWEYVRIAWPERVSNLRRELEARARSRAGGAAAGHGSATSAGG